MTKGVWKLQEVRDLTLSSQWVNYDPVLDSGTLWVWGSFGSGMNTTSITTSSPNQIPGTQWNVLSSTIDTAGAIKTDGTLWMWGSNLRGELGINVDPPSPGNGCISSPVQVTGSQWCMLELGLDTVHAITSSNQLYGWGSNKYGTIGDGKGNIGSNDQNASAPVQIPGTAWCKVVHGCRHTLALKTDGTLWAWGANDCGVLGTNLSYFLTYRSSPVQVPGTQWVNIGVGGPFNSLAIKSDSTLWGWGQNQDGELTRSNVVGTDRSSPVVLPGVGWVDLPTGAINANTVTARKTDGTLWAWGNNTLGSIGNNTTISASMPVQIPGTQWSRFSSAGSVTQARKTDGTLWIWGCNWEGALGNNTSINYSSPIQIPGTQWASVSMSNRNGFAKKV